MYVASYVCTYIHTYHNYYIRTAIRQYVRWCLITIVCYECTYVRDSATDNSLALIHYITSVLLVKPLCC